MQISEHFEIITGHLKEINRELVVLQGEHGQSDEQIEVVSVVEKALRNLNDKIVQLKRSMGLA